MILTLILIVPWGFILTWGSVLAVRAMRRPNPKQPHKMNLTLLNPWRPQNARRRSLSKYLAFSRSFSRL